MEVAVQALVEPIVRQPGSRQRFRPIKTVPLVEYFQSQDAAGDRKRLAWAAYLNMPAGL